jgi:uncharacterized protein (TIGR00661 family)
LKKQKHILFCVLNWGLGHATRSSVLIEKLCLKNHRITIASDGLSLEYLKKRFPTCSFVELPSYNIRYGKTEFSTLLNLFFHVFKSLKIKKVENELIQKIVSQNTFDYIVSDGRFGGYSGQVYSVFITHQLYIKTGIGFLNPIATWLNFRLLQKFNKILIPDFKDVKCSLSGFLSHPKPKDARFVYINPLSSFKKVEFKSQQYKVCFVLSGLEPQRTILENKIIEECKKYPALSFVLVRGTVKKMELEKPKNLLLIDLANAAQIADLASKSVFFCARSGYSTLMDVQAMGLEKVILIPTPGQGEQSYLSDYHRVRCVVVKQELFFLTLLKS